MLGESLRTPAHVMLQALPQPAQPVLCDMEANARECQDINAVHADPRTFVPQPEAELGRRYTQHQAPQQLTAGLANGCSAPAPGAEAPQLQANGREGRVVCFKLDWWHHPAPCAVTWICISS